MGLCFWRSPINFLDLNSFNYCAYKKNSGSRPFSLVLTGVLYLRFTADEPTALTSHMNIHNSRLQRTCCLLNMNKCIARKARSCSLLGWYAKRWSLLCLCYFSVKKIFYNLEMTQGPVRVDPDSTPLQYCVACTPGHTRAGFHSQPPTGAWARTENTTAVTAWVFLICFPCPSNHHFNRCESQSWRHTSLPSHA